MTEITQNIFEKEYANKKFEINFHSFIACIQRIVITHSDDVIASFDLKTFLYRDTNIITPLSLIEDGKYVVISVNTFGFDKHPPAEHNFSRGYEVSLLIKPNLLLNHHDLKLKEI